MTPLHRQLPALLASLDGWCTVEKATAMIDLILETKPRTVVEIGVFGGRSLIPQAMALRELNQGGHIYGIDPWSKHAALEGTNDKANDEWWAGLDLEAIHRKCMQAIWEHRLEPWCAVIRASSEHVADLFDVVIGMESESYEPIDILHLDGNHSEEASTRDVENYLYRVCHGGYIWFDDVNWATTAKALALVAKECDAVKDVITHDATGQHTGHSRLFRKR